MARGSTPRQPSRSGRQDKVARVRTSPLQKQSAARERKPVAPVKSAGKIPAPPRPGAAPKGYDPLAPQRIREILGRLEQRYPAANCALTHHSAWQLLVATILSAQCTDARVNMVTPELFRKYPTPADLAKMKPEQIEPDIRTTGFFRNKAKSIVGAAKMITEQYGGEVPAEMDKLLPVPGVARKTANVVLGTWFGKAEGVVVDTHVQRISRRLELTRNTDPEKIEQDLMQAIPRDKWILFAHQLILHGRALCVARSPKCVDCPLETICHAADKTWSTVDIHKNAK